MPRTFHYTAPKGAHLSVSVTISNEKLIAAEQDREAQIDAIILKICRLADDYFSRTTDTPELNGNPQRIGFYRRKLYRLGVCHTQMLSRIYHAPLPASSD